MALLSPDTCPGWLKPFLSGARDNAGSLQGSGIQGAREEERPGVYVFVVGDKKKGSRARPSL